MRTNAPTEILTRRLVLRRPVEADAGSILARYAADPEVTRFLGWPRHTSMDDARAFVAFSDAEWARWPAGPYLILGKDGGPLLGGTGLGFETPYRASTGYVLARDAWGRGYATESLNAVLAAVPALGLRRVQALCHTAHAASRRVLEKCGFTCEGTLRRYSEFPNLEPGEPLDAFLYARVFEPQPRKDRPVDVTTW